LRLMYFSMVAPYVYRLFENNLSVSIKGCCQLP
jgi:hypothetical protein